MKIRKQVISHNIFKCNQKKRIVVKIILWVSFSLVFPSLYAKNNYSIPLYPEYEAILNSDPSKLLQEFKTSKIIELSRSKNEKAYLLLLRARAYFSIGKYASSKSDIKTGQKLAEKINNRSLIIQYHLLESGLFRTSGNLKKATEQVTIGFKQAIRMKDNRLIALSYLEQGYVQYLSYEYKEALANSIKAYEIFKINKNNTQLVNTLSLIALIYEATEDYEKAIEYHRKSLKFLDVNRHFFEASTIFYNLASVYHGSHQLEKAELNYLKSLELATKANNLEAVAYALAKLGIVASDQGRYSKGEKYLSKALASMITSKNAIGAFYIRSPLAEIYIKQKKFIKAKKIMADLNKFIQTRNIAEYKERWYELNFKLAAGNGNFSDAFMFHKKYLKVKLSIIKQEKKDAISRLEIQFDSKQKEADNIFLREELKIQKLVLDKEKTVNRFNLIIIDFFIVLVLFISYYLYRQTKFKKAVEILALTDELTSLPNRRHILARASEEISRAKRFNEPLIVGLIDLDYFKTVNDTFGHSTGDQVLKLFSKLVKREIRDYDSIGRIGGEEWLLIFPRADKLDLEKIIIRIRQGVKNLTQIENIENMTLTFSMGLALLNDEDKTVEDLLRRADRALYKAKDNGRNCHCYD